MKIADLLRSKGANVVTIAPDSPIEDAMRKLVEHGIGALVVVEDGIRGIISERDLLRCAAADVQKLTTALVRDLMTAEVITAGPEAEIREVMDVMTERRIRHLPVVSGGALSGIISIGDVVNAMRRTVEAENEQLHAYIAGKPL